MDGQARAELDRTAKRFRKAVREVSAAARDVQAAMQAMRDEADSLIPVENCIDGEWHGGHYWRSGNQLEWRWCPGTEVEF